MKQVLKKQSIKHIIVLVFHRILDFKNGAGFLSRLQFFCGHHAPAPVP